MKTKLQGLFAKLCLSGFAMSLLLAAGCVPEPKLYSVGGSVSGLPAGESVKLRLSADGKTQNLEVVFDGSYAFPLQVTEQKSYSIVIVDTPSAQFCTLANGSGVVKGKVSSANVVCEEIPIADAGEPKYNIADQLALCIKQAGADEGVTLFSELRTLSCDTAVYPITSAAGLGYLGELTTLNIINTQQNVDALVDVDLRRLTKLRILYLSLDKMVGTIDLSQNVALESLNLQFNYLTSINLNANLSLDTVNIDRNCWSEEMIGVDGTSGYLGSLDDGRYITYFYLGENPLSPGCPTP